VSETVSPVAADSREAVAPPARRGRGRWVTAGSALVLVAAGTAAASYAGAFSPAASPGDGAAAAPATQAVTRQDLAAQTPVSATLGYAGSYLVAGRGGGTLTWLPAPGQVIRQGQALYRVDNGVPVVLLLGRVPAWRPLSEGMTGQDVRQLNHDLVRLGDASRAGVSALGWDYYSWATSAGVQKLEARLGLSSPGGSLALGSVVFEPTALRVSSLPARLGGPAAGPILAATADRHVVTVSLSTSLESEVAAGDAVTITLPDQATTPGVVTSVGTVAAGPASSPAIPVSVRLSRPAAAGSLDQAPVTVEITTASASQVLAVPVGALLAQSGGGYAVEVAGRGSARRLVAVKVGLFDDAAGLVQVTGALRPGQHVVVPST
jgi:hypothetical protein